VHSIALENVSLAFKSGAGRIAAVENLSLVLSPGRFNVIAGPSGSGKTTLLSILGGLLRPDTGSVRVAQQDITRLAKADVERYRREKVGYVFQAFRLMRALTATDNVSLSLEVRRIEDRTALAADALEMVGMTPRAHLKPDQMSGGEQQRVAIARAIAHRPKIVLADEPTANLDRANSAQIVQILAQLSKDPERVVIAVSHDPRLAEHADRIVRLEDGRLVGDQTCRSE
jgi:putative ABC transport system ATP-binding protein